MRQTTRQRTAMSESLPAPVGGWNARDALAMMEPTDAIIMDNWFPRPDRILVRGGSSQWATGLGGSVDSLFQFSSGTATKLIGAANGHLWDCTSRGAATSLASGFTSNQWHGCMMTTPGGAFLLLFDGVDTPQTYNGTAVAANTITGSGLTASNLIGAAVYRSRVFMVESGTLNLWYLPVNSISGTALSINLGQYCKLGGYLVAAETWAAMGSEQGLSYDVLAVVTSEGEILTFEGTDPSSANTWSLVGIFRGAKPLGRRCLMKMGADLLMILQDGVYTASSVLYQNIREPALAMSDKIRSAFNDASASFGSVFGWQSVYYPQGQRLLINVPLDANGVTYAQFTMNSISKSWCRFVNWNARSWAVFNSIPYFGDASGVVWKSDTGNVDNGVAVTAQVKQAFSNLGVQARTKHLTMARPRLQSEGAPYVGIGADADFADTPMPPANLLPGNVGSPWDTSPWNTSPWSSGEQILEPWISLGVIGTVISLKLNAQSLADLAWFQTEIVAEPGDVL